MKINKNQKMNMEHYEEQYVEQYIVDVNTPEPGQEVSSGGVRENGKIVTQYKNPRPYTEPTPDYSQQTEAYSMMTELKQQCKIEGIGLLFDLIKTGYYEFLKPYICLKYRERILKRAERIEAKNAKRIEVSEANSLTESIIEDEKIIDFNSKKAI